MKTADLNYLGIQKDEVPVNLNKIRLIEEALSQQEGHLTDTGALSVLTGKDTGRSPDDRYIVDNDASQDVVEWGKVNVPISQKTFDRLYNKVIRYLEDRKIYVYDGWAGADEEFRLPLRVVTEAAYQNLFVNNPDSVHFSYLRFLENRLRETFGFEGTPLHLIFRGKKDGDDR